MKITCIEKPGTGVYLLREKAKVSRSIGERKMFKVSKRLGAEEEKNDSLSQVSQQPEKRFRNTDGKGIPVSSSAPGKQGAESMRLQ